MKNNQEQIMISTLHQFRTTCWHFFEMQNNENARKSTQSRYSKPKIPKLFRTVIGIHYYVVF